MFLNTLLLNVLEYLGPEGTLLIRLKQQCGLSVLSPFFSNLCKLELLGNRSVFNFNQFQSNSNVNYVNDLI